MFLENPGAVALSISGNDESRIGPNKRNAKLKVLDRIEKLISENLGHEFIVDMGTCEGPYFKRYSYCDLLEGIKLNTTSMEINTRVLKHCIDTKDEVELSNFTINENTDKYALTIPKSDTVYDNVIMFTGSNYTYVLKADLIRELMSSEVDPWYIKPHPLTDEKLVMDLANHYGFDKVFSNSVSGNWFYKNSKCIVTTATSEFLIKAALDRKSYIDATKKHLYWQCTYGDIAYFLNEGDVEHNFEVVNVSLRHPSSGYLHADMDDSEIIERIRNYTELTQSLKEPFKMLLGQTLTAVDDNVGIIEEHALRKGRPKNTQYRHES